jgi:hypothetical protein
MTRATHKYPPLANPATRGTLFYFCNMLYFYSNHFVTMITFFALTSFFFGQIMGLWQYGQSDLPTLLSSKSLPQCGQNATTFVPGGKQAFPRIISAPACR